MLAEFLTQLGIEGFVGNLVEVALLALAVKEGFDITKSMAAKK